MPNSLTHECTPDPATSDVARGREGPRSLFRRATDEKNTYQKQHRRLGRPELRGPGGLCYGELLICHSPHPACSADIAIPRVRRTFPRGLSTETSAASLPSPPSQLDGVLALVAR